MVTAVRHYNGKDNLRQDQEVIVLPILGLDGVQALVADYDNRLSIPEGMEIPRQELQWPQVQQTEWNDEWEPAEGDLDYRHLFHRLAEGGEVTVSNPKQTSQKLTFTRTQILHEVEGDALIQIGPLKRKIDWTHKTHTMVFPILIKREGQVILARRSWTSWPEANGKDHWNEVLLANYSTRCQGVCEEVSLLQQSEGVLCSSQTTNSGI